MDDSPLYSLIIFIVFIVINALLYAFGDAVRMLNESDVEKNAEDGDKKSAKLKRIIDNPDKFISTVHMVTCVTVAIVGFFHLKNYSVKCQSFFVNHIGAYMTDGFITVISYSCSKETGSKVFIRLLKVIGGLCNIYYDCFHSLYGAYHIFCQYSP